MLRILFLAALVAAQPPSTGAVLVLYQIKPGMDRDFTLGDQRHLDWHRGQNDPWLWPGWTIASGEHQGYFLEATFFHPWTDFDNPSTKPGAGAKFESAISAGLRATTIPHMVLRPVTGAAEYLIMLTAQKQADLPDEAVLLETMMQTAGTFVDRVRTETWSYRPELSYRPRYMPR